VYCGMFLSLSGMSDLADRASTTQGTRYQSVRSVRTLDLKLAYTTL
jgi:hypothetical protein